jgi:hypothetical protein
VADRAVAHYGASDDIADSRTIAPIIVWTPATLERMELIAAFASVGVSGAAYWVQTRSVVLRSTGLGCPRVSATLRIAVRIILSGQLAP